MRFLSCNASERPEFRTSAVFSLPEYLHRRPPRPHRRFHARASDSIREKLHRILGRIRSAAQPYATTPSRHMRRLRWRFARIMSRRHSDSQPTNFPDPSFSRFGTTKGSRRTVRSFVGGTTSTSSPRSVGGDARNLPPPQPASTSPQ